MSEIKKYRVNSECIGCRACAELSVKNFSMDDNGKAAVVKQPETVEEEALCDDAAMLCPTSAIEVLEEAEVVEQEQPGLRELQAQAAQAVEEPEAVMVSENDNIKKVVDRFPELKDFLVKISPKFKRLYNPVLYNFFCRFMSFGRAARTINVPVDNLLDSVNRYLSRER